MERKKEKIKKEALEANVVMEDHFKNMLEEVK